MVFYYLLNSSKDYQKIENEDKKDEEFKNHKQEMGIENERERTSSMLDCKHNVLQEQKRKEFHQKLREEGFIPPEEKRIIFTEN